MNYFVKTFQVKDGTVFVYNKADIERHLPDNYDIKSGLLPIITFSPGAVTVAVEVFVRKNR